MFDHASPARFIGQKNQTFLFLMFSYHQNYELMKELDTSIRARGCFSPILLMENKALAIHVCIPKRIQNVVNLIEQHTYYLTIQMKKHNKGPTKIYYNLIVTDITETLDYSIDTVESTTVDASKVQSDFNDDS